MIQKNRFRTGKARPKSIFLVPPLPRYGGGAGVEEDFTMTDTENEIRGVSCGETNNLGINSEIFCSVPPARLELAF